MYQNDELVWAKLRGYCHWPAKIVDPPPNHMRALHKSPKSFCVYFFGSHDYSWIATQNLDPYSSIKAKRYEATGKAIKKVHLRKQFEEALHELTGGADDEGTKRKKKKEKTHQRCDDFNQPEVAWINNISLGNSIVDEADSIIDERDVAVPIKDELLPVEVEVIPVKIEKNRIKVETTSTKTKRVKLETVSVKVETVPDAIPRKVDAKKFHVGRSKVDPLAIKSEPTQTANDDPKFTFGFISPDDFGCMLAEKLIDNGVKVCGFLPMDSNMTAISGIKLTKSPLQVFASSHFVFSYAPDTQSTINAWKTQYGDGNIRHLKKIPKGLFSMISKDVEASIATKKAFNDFEVKYLEAKILGSLMSGTQQLLITAAGDGTLFDTFKEYFGGTFRLRFLGNVENLSKINMVTQTFAAITTAGLGSSLTLAEKAGISSETLSSIVATTSLRSDLIMDSLQSMTKNDYTKVNMSVKNMQKDLDNALAAAYKGKKVLPLTSIANEMYKMTKNADMGNFDAAAVKEIVNQI